MISDKTIEDVKLRIDIVDVISDFVNLKKAGQNYKGLSPFNDEKSPSFFVSPTKGIYKDFSSGKGGDAISFIMEYDGMNYLEAIRHLATKYGIEIEETESTDEERQAQTERESIYIILNYAKEFFKKQLTDHPDGKAIGLSYFRERGFNEVTIDKFDLGYSLSGWDHLLEDAKKAGYSEEILEKAGLIVKKEEKVYDRFRGRVMFPIHNLSGKTIAFGARILTSDKKQPKYINTPETSVYNKSNVLYGLYQAKQHIRKEDNCYLAEGYTDVISLSQSGIGNVVSSSGTSLTEGQIAQVARYTNNITILYDGDVAGLQASLRGIDMILKKGLNVRVVLFPEGEDPDSYLRKVGTTGFLEYLKGNAKDFVSFQASYFANMAGQDPAARADAIREIVKTVSLIPDPLKRSVYLNEVSSLFNLDEGVLVAESNKFILGQRKKEKAQAQSQSQPPPSEEEFIYKDQLGGEINAKNLDDVIIEHELECIRLLFNYGIMEVEEGFNYYHYFFRETEEIRFLHSLHVEMINLYANAIKEGIVPDHNFLISQGGDELKNLTAQLYFERYSLSENWKEKYDIVVLNEREMLDKMFSRNILFLKFRNAIKIQNEYLSKLKEVKGTDEEGVIMDYYHEYKNIGDIYAKELGIVVIK